MRCNGVFLLTSFKIYTDTKRPSRICQTCSLMDLNVKNVQLKSACNFVYSFILKLAGITVLSTNDFK